MLTELQKPSRCRMFFSGYERERSGRLMGTLDAITGEYGMHTVSFAGGGTHKPWRMQAGHKSPRYTTSWDELATAH